MPTVTIRELGRHAGAAVTVQGWVMTTRSSGKIAFLVLRDGSGYLQCVFPKAEGTAFRPAVCKILSSDMG